MKVTGQKPLNPSELASGKAHEADPRNRKSGDAAADSKSPLGSRTSLTLSKARESIRNTPDIRTDRVEAVKQKIRSGAFKVDPERLASKMIAESLREDIEKD